ncbi:MAG TPA: MerR family transcriptional regulator [Kofleriaceae bacterium]|nr:MerR family transcriptional regulator [Kofleriaceae bacterium]
MDALWTLPELVAEVATRIAALPAPRNGQVRAIPDERTVRYYVTLGLLDRPSEMRGRTALYGPRHAAQVVAIKRLQTMGRSLSDIQQLWSTLDDATLARMSGVALPAAGKPAVRAEFWKRAPVQLAAEPAAPPAPAVAPPAPPAPFAPPAQAAVELRIELAPQVVLSLSVVDDRVAVSPADVRAIRAAAAPLLAELASRRLALHPEGEEP